MVLVQVFKYTLLLRLGIGINCFGTKFFALTYSITRQEINLQVLQTRVSVVQTKLCSSENGSLLIDDSETKFSSDKYVQRDRLAQSFHDAGGFLYRPSVVPCANFDVAVNELFQKDSSKPSARLTVPLTNEVSSSVAKHRTGAVISPASHPLTFQHIVDSPDFACLVNRLMSYNNQIFSNNVEPKWERSTHIPVEIRVYETKGAGMEWHVDDVLYDPPQLEVVFTLENTSDCVTAWEPKGDTKMSEVESEPNSSILLLAGGVPHKVTPLQYGRRVILKFVYVQKGATFLGESFKHQFHTNRKTYKKAKRD